MPASSSQTQEYQGKTLCVALTGIDLLLNLLFALTEEEKLESNSLISLPGYASLYWKTQRVVLKIEVPGITARHFESLDAAVVNLKERNQRAKREGPSASFSSVGLFDS